MFRKSNVSQNETMLPNLLMPASSQINLAQLALMDWLSDEELEVQREIIKARNYHYGEQFSFLTDRLREFIDVDDLEVKFRLNVCRPVVSAVTERLAVIGFDCPGAEVQDANGSTTNPQSDWAWNVWQRNRMDAKQDDVHDGAVRDREYFVLVDWDDVNQMPRFTPHQRYTDAEADGDGEGCKAIYANDDPNQELLYVAKRWSEFYTDERGQFNQRMRMTLYYPDRVEKYAMERGGWDVFTGDGDNGVVEWKDAAGKPLGIAAVHFRNKDLQCEAREALPIQDAINKTYIDFLAAADTASLRILYTLGFVLTTDGKPLKEDQSNAAKIVPGMVAATTKSAQEAAIGAIEPFDPTKLLDAIDRQILYAASVTDTPASRFQFSKQVAAADTLKEQNEPLFAKIEKRQILLGNGWEDVMTFARRLANFKARAGFDETKQFQTRWRDAHARTLAEQQAEVTAKKTANVPDEQIWREVFGYDEKTIAQMKQTDEFQARLALVNNTSQNLGGGAG